MRSIKNSKLALFCGFILSINVATAKESGQCWEVENMKGYSVYAMDQFDVFEDDGFSAVTYIDFGKVSISPNAYNGVCAEAPANSSPLSTALSLVCMYPHSTEVWTLYPRIKKAVLVRSRTAPVLSSALLLVGDIVRTCISGQKREGASMIPGERPLPQE